MDVARNTDIGLIGFDELPDTGTTNMLAGVETVYSGMVGRTMGNEDFAWGLFDHVITRHEIGGDFFLTELGWAIERRCI
jgi:hypothetical protein